MRKGLLGCLLIGSLSIGADLSAKENAADGPRPIPTPEEYAAASQRFSQHIEKGLGIEFIGVTRNGTQVPGLFEIRSTGVSTRPVVDSAAAFLASLSERQLEETAFPGAGSSMVIV